MASVDTGEGPAATVPRATVSHAIFDMDGLLLDTEGFYTEVQEKILARYGKVFDWSLKAKMMGKKATESAHIFIDECGLASLLTPEQFLEEREGMLQELFPSCAVLPVWMDAARIADSSCFPQYNASLKCLETNQDKSKCQQQFDDYKECKKREGDQVIDAEATVVLVVPDSCCGALICKGGSSSNDCLHSCFDASSRSKLEEARHAGSRHACMLSYPCFCSLGDVNFWDF